MTHARTATMIVGLLATAAGAETISQQVDFSIDGFQGGTITFDRFDDMGGTRELTGVSFSYDQTIEFDMTIESNGYTGLEQGDWLLDAGYRTLHQMGVYGRGDGGPSYPAFGAGGFYAIQISADLGASDGYNGSGPDTYNLTAGESFIFNESFSNDTSFGQNVLQSVMGEGQLDTFMGGFTDLFFEWVNDPNWVVDPNNPPDGPFDGPFQDPYYGIFVSFDRILHSGSLTINYEYSVVPAPSGLLLMSGAGMLAIRRRR